MCSLIYHVKSSNSNSEIRWYAIEMKICRTFIKPTPHISAIKTGEIHFWHLVATRIGQESEALARNRKNWTVRLGKPDGSVLLIPTAVRGTTGTR
jgi:hypothetical protein